MRPIVYLIGTGPGDPGLISARGARYLAAADVVLYDHLVHPRLLRYPRQDAEKIDVGSASPQPLDQEAINYLLVEKAREGKIVARLKWGDPFLFDRGGQEALFLHEHGIPFEVVPGIPAAIGTTSYAGVPLTYPGGGDSVTFVRGHEDESSKVPNVDWASLARLGGTLVCYAGSRQLHEILNALVANGFDPNEPAAIIYDGTLPTQRTTDGTLQELVEMKNLRTKPAILVVGRVVGLRQHLRWFDERPLFGKKIVVTRSREQAGELVDMLESLGAEPIEAPMIRVEAPDDYGPLDKAAAEAGTYDWIVFTSANAVDFFMRRLMAGSGVGMLYVSRHIRHRDCWGRREWAWFSGARRGVGAWPARSVCRQRHRVFLEAMGRESETVEALREILGMDTVSGIGTRALRKWHLLATSVLKRGELDQAEKLFLELMAWDPESPALESMAVHPDRNQSFERFNGKKSGQWNPGLFIWAHPKSRGKAQNGGRDSQGIG